MPQRDTDTEPEPENATLVFPEHLACEILSHTTPQHVCGLSALSKHFASAAESNDVWSNFLPQQLQDQILSRAVSPIAFSSTKELYFHLCNSIMIDGGTKMFWLERSTAKVGYMLSARDLSITWGDDDRYWRWVSREDSRFKEVAELLRVSWLEVRGRIDCRLLSPNTEYRVVFILKFRKPYRVWEETPVKFSVTTPDGQVLERTRDLTLRYQDIHDYGWLREEDADRYDDNGWLHLVVGKFTVKGDGSYDNSSPHVDFCMEEYETGFWKYGLLIDGVRIEPADRHTTHQQAAED